MFRAGYTKEINRHVPERTSFFLTKKQTFIFEGANDWKFWPWGESKVR